MYVPIVHATSEANKFNYVHEAKFIVIYNSTITTNSGQGPSLVQSYTLPTQQSVTTISRSMAGVATPTVARGSNGVIYFDMS